MKKFVAVVICAICADALFAEDYGWASTATDAGKWHTVASWTNSVGEAAAVAPSEATDTVTFPFIDYKRRIVDLVKSDGTAAAIASLSGASTWRMRFNTATDTWGGKVADFSVGDINGFAGEWESIGSKKTLVLTAASGVQTLPLARVSQQFSLNVVNAATTADIVQLRGTEGSVRKTGAGDLRIRDVAEPGNLVLEIEQGNVQVDGKPKTPIASDAAVLRKAAVHLDASVRSTWETGSYVDGDGRTRVTKWLDVHGNGAYAEIWDNSGDKVASHLKEVLPPFISSTRSSTGLPFMDFGATGSATADTYGPRALMRLDTRIADAQEVFFVSALNNGANVLGDSDEYVFSGSDAYVFTYGATILANGGFVRFNGNRNWQNLTQVSGIYRMTRTYDSYTTATTDPMLTNVRFGDGNAQAVCYLASDRLLSAGGVRIGELLIFTEALTDDERAAVTDYLMRKWFANADHHDFHLANAANGTSITVPEGREARIDTLRVKGTTFTKKGAGTLRVGRIYPEDLSITIEGGDVKLDTTVATGAVAAPVGTPQFWFDAESANAFEKDGDNVTAWCDCRDATKKTSRYYPDALTAYPYADTESMPGHTVLTFPNKSAFQLPSGNQRESFVAFSYTANISSYNVLGNGYTTDRGGSPAPVFAKWSVLPDAMGGGIYSVDGMPVRPSESVGTTFVLGQWHVAHLSTTAALNLNILASNGPRSNAGNVRVAEIITYTTALTPDERRKNIDYLMNRWTGKRHPEFSVPSKSPTLAFSGDAELGSDTEATYAAVTGSGSLVKTGIGSATITNELADSFTDLAVEGGTLTIAKPSDPEDRSIYHFDASDASTFTDYFVDANGETNVQQIADVRGNGTYAYKRDPYYPSSGSLFAVTNPIVRFAEFAPGVTRPYLDFLTHSGRNVDPPKGAGLAINPQPGSTAAKEIHAVVATHSACDLICGASSISFKRGLKDYNDTKAKIFRMTGESSACSEDVLNGYIAVDGVITAASKYLDYDKFYLLSVAPLSGMDASSISLEMANTSGGRCYGEIMAFSEYLSAKERAYRQNKLMYKWFGQGEDPVWTNELDSVAVAAGSILTVQGGAIAVPTISGSGMIAASKVLGISTINLAATDRTTLDGLAVDGVADFAESVTVNIAGAVDLAPGEYTLVSATSLANVDLASWTLSVQPKRPYTLKQVGNSVVLAIEGPGLILIVQ